MPSHTCCDCGQPLARIQCQRVGRTAYCATCQASKGCFYCGAQLGSASSRTADGRPVCAACAATAIRDAGQAALLYKKVLACIENEVGLQIQARPRFGLCPPVELRRVSRYVASRRGVDGRVLGVYLNIDERGGILVEEGLPYWTLITVIAHEIGHAWQIENDAARHNPQILEGFCEWIAFQVLGMLGGQRQQDRLMAQKHFHGKALRAVLAIEQAVGREGLLQQMRASALAP